MKYINFNKSSVYASDIFKEIDDIESLEKVTVEFQPNTFLHQNTISFLCLLGIYLDLKGGFLLVNSDDNIGRYLSRMGLYELINRQEDIDVGAKDASGRFLPLHLIRNEQDVYEVTNAICELVIN